MQNFEQQSENRADEVRQLILCAVNCGYLEDETLFDKILDRVYPNKAAELEQVIAPMMNILTNVLEQASREGEKPCQ